MITPTTDANKDGIYSASDVGHVNGVLTIGSTPYDWLALPFKKEIKTGITTNSFTWTTKNPYGKDVRLNLYTSPSSEILIEKNVVRIGGYDSRSEVFSPIIWFRTPQSTAEYRVTALLSSFTTEEAKTAQNIAVSGTGHALQAHSTRYDDYIYTGKGVSSFAIYATDANTAFIRKMGSMNEYTLIDGSYLKRNGSTLVSTSQKIEYFTLKQEGTSTKFSVKAASATTITLNNTVANSITRNGVVYTNWVKDSSAKTTRISIASGEHMFELSGQNVIASEPITNTSVNRPPVLDPVGLKTITTGQQIVFKVNGTDPDKNTLTYSATNLPANATFSPGTRSFVWTPGASQVGNHNVTFNVSECSLKDSETVQITVKSITIPGIKTLPKAQFTASVTKGQAPLDVQFTDKSMVTGIATYKWEFKNDAGTITSTSTEKNPSITYRITGNKTVKLMVTNASGSDSEIKTDYIKVS
jgi:PKD repeat protein